jgi:hypothetical protein
MVKIGGVELKVRTNSGEFLDKRRSECVSEGHKRERIIRVSPAQTNCYCLYCFSDYSRPTRKEDRKRFYGYASQKVLETEVNV